MRCRSARGVGVRVLVLVALVFALVPVTAVPTFAVAPLSVYGTITDADTVAPIQDAQVSVYRWDDGESDWVWVDWTSTNASGGYTFYDSELPADDLMIEVWVEGYESGADYCTYDGSTPQQVNVALVPFPHLAEGTITDADSSDPIEWASLDFYYIEYDGWDEEWYWAGSDYTASDGTYVVYDEDGYGAGDYEVEVFARGYVSSYDMVTWDGGDPVAYDVALTPASTVVTGTVTDASTSDPLDAYIELELIDPEEGAFWVDEAETGTNGSYELYDSEEYGAGTYRARAGSSGYAAEEYEFDWDGVTTVVHDFELAEASLLASGTITDADTSDPIEDVCVDVYFYDQEYGYYRSVSWDFSSSDGSYEVFDEGNFGPGDYRFVIDAWGYADIEYDTAWDALTPMSLDFELTALEPLVADAYEPDNTYDQATPIATDGTGQEHTFFPTGDEDWVEFDVTAGETYVIETYDLDLWGADTVLYLYDSDGTTLLDENDDQEEGLYSLIEYTAEDDTTLYAKVVDYDNDDEGDYGIKVTQEAPATPVIAVQGDNRYETAVEASKLAFPSGADTVVIATGSNWPDALGGTSLAGALEGPVLLVGTSSVPDAVMDEIERLEADSAIILGGTTAVGTPVETALKAELGAGNVERIAGDDRYETANLVAERVIDEMGVGYSGYAFVATGSNFPDALAAAPLAASEGWPLFLADPTTGLSNQTKAAMADVSDAVILGGTKVVSTATENYLKGELGAGYVTRLYGDDRYGTAVEVSYYAVDEWGHMWDRVGLTTGLDFPDALAGGVLQGRYGSVMLLTEPDWLNEPTADALLDNAEDISTVTFFGGSNAVSDDVRDEVDWILAP